MIHFLERFFEKWLDAQPGDFRARKYADVTIGCLGSFIVGLILGLVI